MDISEKDWRVFRANLPMWQERHMGELVRSYKELLDGSEKASEKFWALEERIRKDKRHSGVVATVSRSNMMHILLELRRDGIISDEEMTKFSEEVQSTIAYFCMEY